MDGNAIIEFVKLEVCSQSPSEIELRETFEHYLNMGSFEPEKHESQFEMESKLGVTYNNLLHTMQQYQHGEPVYFAPENWQGITDLSKYGTLIARTELHQLLYAYLIKRSTAIYVLQNEGFVVKDRGSCWTDDAFARLTCDIVRDIDYRVSHIRDLPKFGPTLVVEDPQLKRAFRLVKDAPMFFDIRRNRSHAIAWFCFPPAAKDRGDDSQKKFEIAWDLINDLETARTMRKDTKAMFDLNKVKIMTREEMEDTFRFDLIGSSKCPVPRTQPEQ